ncbi:MAG: 4-(cytidine 5'-diphospho)-2-C-methyl-D-erythritol kinase [Acidimicrobiales bacterium]|nr:4-(cytidine 5'-diphospho)-2-C-methyl-D-erythritol kinase [Acidimicrobiales bacterium]RZV42985.1 MAG: 4-(cytidine 5'-diphospho)-2-C-methyl-D-erythritol kinase [Acidimicrobiales bacterium]
MSAAVVVKAFAKLTLSLRVTGVRDDGYHLIDAEMVTIDLADELTIVPGGSGVSLSDSGVVTELAGDPEDNLVSRALRLAGRDAQVIIDKAIPPGAGLGGGSADAAAVLRWAGYDDVVASAGIGADVAFCLVGGRARVRGIGEIVEPLPHVEREFTIVTPPLFCSTPAVYRRWDELGGPEADGPNDLEPAALSVAPELARFRDALGDATGRTPMLAGSGSSWFVDGAFPAAGVVVRTIPAVS